LSKDFRLVGKWRGRRLDSQQKVSGQMPFANDFNIPGQAHMRILHSQVPSGTIASIDASSARSIPGVLAVITPDDIKNDPVWSNVKWGLVPVLPYDRIRVSGEEIAAVAAEDPYVAEQACQAIKVTYTPSPFVLHPLDAIAAEAPQVFPGYPNLSAPTVYAVGDADAAMADPSSKVFSSTFENSHIQHNNVNSWAFVVRVDTTGRTEIWSSNQYAKLFQASLAAWLGIAQSRVKCHNIACDGGFGDKIEPNRAHMLGTLLSQKTGRPIKYRCSHEDNLVLGNHRVKNTFTIQAAYRADGTVTALRAQIHGNNSAFGGGGAAGSATELFSIFRLPHFKIATYDVFTNTPKSGPMRCVADPAACWAVNSFMDHLANTIGMSYASLIRRNPIYGPGDTDQLSGSPIVSCGLPDCFEKVLSLSGFEQKWKPIDASKKVTGVAHGIGLALHSCNHGLGNSTTSLVIMRPDASLEIHADSNEMGQGKREELAIVAAEHMGLPLGMVTLDNYSSDDGTDTGVSAGSSQTKRAGSSIGLACIDAKDQMMSKAASVLSVDVGALTYALDGSMKIFVTADPTKSVSFASLTGEPMIVGVGRWATPSNRVQRSYGASVAEVDVDTDTGMVRVTDIFQVHDVGRVLFRGGIEGQAHGGIIQALGMALQEEQWPDIPTGKQLIIDNLDLKMPISTQVPPIHLDWVETVEQPPDSYNHGAKGFGEPPTSPPVAAITNAIANAIGWWPDALPATPDKVLRALGKP
jgi:CO/xanthine dehydrogenase Mo-binding subunit